MDQDGSGVTEGREAGRLVLPSLVVTRLALGVPYLAMSLLLIEIGETFGLSVGAAGQISTVSSVVAFVGALLMGFLSMRFRHKHLLLVGMVIFTIAIVGCAFSPLFSIMLVSYSLVGLGGSMAIPMTYTMVGDLYPISRRAAVMGYVMAGASLAFLIGAPATTFVAGFGGWRTAFLAVVFPLVALGTVLSYFGIPSVVSGEEASAEGRGVGEGFREILLNRSAMACLLGTALNEATWQAILVYSISFMRQVFGVSMGFASMFIIGGALLYTVGSVVSGRIIDRVALHRASVKTTTIRPL